MPSDHHGNATRPGRIHEVSASCDGRPSDVGRSDATMSASEPITATCHAALAAVDSPETRSSAGRLAVFARLVAPWPYGTPLLVSSTQSPASVRSSAG